jgi:hypothetical protein
MNWNTDDIVRETLAAVFNGNLQGDLVFPLYDSERQVGVGIRDTNELVLMLPPQFDVDAFEAAHAKYNPVVDLYQPGETADIVSRSLLRCSFSADDLGQIQAIASIFAGLLSLELATPNTGAAIWAMKALFDSGFVSDAPIESVKGLFGELLVLQDYGFDPHALSSWHSDPGSKFDFSRGDLRLEVKTTAGAVRAHHFSEGQVPGPEGVRVFVASVLLQVVESGGRSLGEFLMDLQKVVTPGDFTRILEISSDYLKTNPLAIVKPRVDIQGSMRNLAYFEAEGVPRPQSVLGVSELSWTASLVGLDSEELRPKFF